MAMDELVEVFGFPKALIKSVVKDTLGTSGSETREDLSWNNS